MPLTPNHGYNVPNKGETDWHKPLNQNFQRYDTDIEVRDEASNRSNYDPKAGAKFLATDTEEVYVGDGSSWNQLKTSGRSPKFDEINPSNNFLGVGRDSKVASEEFFGVQATVKSGDFGGMDVNGADPESRPYYGYATDGTEHAYHYYDGADDVWRLNTGNTEKLSASQGFVGVNGATRGTFLGNIAFGIEADTSGTDFGGMFVETSSSDGRAQVAYKTAGSPQLAAYFDGSDGTYRLERYTGFTNSKFEILKIDSDGNLTVPGDVNGDSKNFVESVDTDDGEKEVVYTATEAGTPHTEASGVAELEDGRAEVELPDHFEWVTDGDEPIVVQITPYGGESGTKVVERSTDRFVVEDLDGEGDYEFAYTVKGTREGKADKQIVREPSADEGTGSGGTGQAPADD